jgi:hypothetical protein
MNTFQFQPAKINAKIKRSLRRRQNSTKTDDVRNDYRISHISAKEIKDLFLTTKIFGRKILITIWSCTHHTHLFRPTCLIINTCDQNWRENARLPLAYAEIFPMDFPTLPYALIFSITGIAVEVLMVANDRGTECKCCCWIVVNLWIVVAGCGSLWLVLGRRGSLWGRCGVVVGRCGSLWIVVGRSMF